MQLHRVFPTHKLGNWVDENWMHLKNTSEYLQWNQFLNSMYRGFRCYSLQGRHVFGILYFSIMHLFTFPSFSWQIELCAGVGRALALQGLWRFCPYLLRQYIFNQNLCIGFSEFNKLAMCYISHSHFFSILLFLLPLRTELSTHFILIKVCCYNG